MLVRPGVMILASNDHVCVTECSGISIPVIRKWMCHVLTDRFLPYHWFIYRGRTSPGEQRTDLADVHDLLDEIEPRQRNQFPEAYGLPYA